MLTWLTPNQRRPSESQPAKDGGGMRFVLIHGGFHGAWCWSRTIPELEALGHEAIAIDIPGHRARVHEEATLQGRLDAASSVLQPGHVLLGRSGGRLDAPRYAHPAPAPLAQR